MKRMRLMPVGAAPDKAKWRFCLADNGIGMEPEYLDSVFVTARRLHVRASREGTRNGRMVAEKTVERQGGQTLAEAQPRLDAIVYLAPAGAQP